MLVLRCSNCNSARLTLAPVRAGFAIFPLAGADTSQATAEALLARRPRHAFAVQAQTGEQSPSAATFVRSAPISLQQLALPRKCCCSLGNCGVHQLAQLLLGSERVFRKHTEQHTSTLFHLALSPSLAASSGCVCPASASHRRCCCWRRRLTTTANNNVVGPLRPAVLCFDCTLPNSPRAEFYSSAQLADYLNNQKTHKLASLPAAREPPTSFAGLIIIADFYRSRRARYNTFSLYVKL